MPTRQLKPQPWKALKMPRIIPNALLTHTRNMATPRMCLPASVMMLPEATPAPNNPLGSLSGKYCMAHRSGCDAESNCRSEVFHAP